MKGFKHMEKITKEELLKTLKLTEEDLATVAGGSFAACDVKQPTM